MALAHAIVAFLVDRPGSGYDIAKRFNGSVGFFWKATHQQIYRELARLEIQGWVGFESVAQASRPDKKLYHLTDLGRQQLIDWVAQPADVMPIKEELLVKLFVGNLVPRRVILQELQRHRQYHEEKLAEFQAIAQQHFADLTELPIDSQFQYLTLRRGIRYETDYIAWCEEAIQLLRLVGEDNLSR